MNSDAQDDLVDMLRTFHAGKGSTKTNGRGLSPLRHYAIQRAVLLTIAVGAVALVAAAAILFARW